MCNCLSLSRHTIKSLEYFVANDSSTQRRLLKMLDKWIVMRDEDIVEECKKISQLDSISSRSEIKSITQTFRFERVEQKVVKKVAARLASKYNLESDLSVCGNLYHDKIETYLTFSALELRAKVVM